MDENNIYQTTKSGLEKLVNELKDREKNLRVKIANTLNEMRSQGDLRENDGYTMALEEQNINEERILELKEKIKNAKVIKDKSKNKVGIGDTVILKGEKNLKYEITSEEEANPLEGKVSHLSPIGKSVINKKKGEEVKIETPTGVKKYKIESIE
ncbi:MAG: GreA/GreB family elongation factor [Candidatus Dojkabacteria bacterium]|jgi:transcription elongation factor GreA